MSTFSFIGGSDPEREATLRRDLAGPLLTADALACILAFTAIAIGFINNAPW